jgi:formamidopyrimidine-DNA glycosylase
LPELPEVETVRQGLEPLTLRRTIKKVQIKHARVLRRNSSSAAAFRKSLASKTIKKVSRRGKYLWFEFEQSPQLLVAHLGLSGQFRPVSAQGQKVRHERLRITFTDDGDELAFCDQRTFGGLYLDEPAGQMQVPSSISHIALDPFDPAFELDPVIERARSKRVAIKAALLDQTLISGVGNIYADESLWRSRIHPLTRASTLTRPRLRELFRNVNDVMSEALGSGGTTFDGLYVSVNGESGSFSERLDAYGRGGKACRRCGKKLMREKFANRSSVRCPKCQPIPRSVR